MHRLEGYTFKIPSFRLVLLKSYILFILWPLDFVAWFFHSVCYFCASAFTANRNNSSASQCLHCSQTESEGKPKCTCPSQPVLYFELLPRFITSPRCAQSQTVLIEKISIFQNSWTKPLVKKIWHFYPTVQLRGDHPKTPLECFFKNW